MSVYIDHLLRNDEKYLALTDTQRARLYELWQWIDEQQTDGRIPDHIPKALGIRTRDLERLKELHWIDENGAGLIAHDWHDHNPPVEPTARTAWYNQRRQGRHRNAKRNAGVTHE